MFDVRINAVCIISEQKINKINLSISKNRTSHDLWWGAVTPSPPSMTPLYVGTCYLVQIFLNSNKITYMLQNSVLLRNSSIQIIVGTQLLIYFSKMCFLLV